MIMRIKIRGQGYCHFDIVHAHYYRGNTCSSVQALRWMFGRIHFVFVFILNAVPTGEGQTVTSETLSDLRKWFNDKWAVRKEKL
jgi:hypothetical protein